MFVRMQLGIMQPYFLPYLGYFGLMEATDRWIVFDTPQYIRRGWVNRNRVLTKGKDVWKYISVPVVKCPRETPIRDVLIDGQTDWVDDLVRKLDYYRDHGAPYYTQTVDFLQRILRSEERRLSAVLTSLLGEVCGYLGLDAKINVFSEMSLNIGPVSHPGEWALRICEAVGATTYINPPGGREIFDPKQFADAGIELQFLTPALPAYDQRRAEFLPGLSIIDALMWNSRQEVLAMAQQYSLDR